MANVGPTGRSSQVLMDLVIKQATEGLSDDETSELSTFDRESIDAKRREFGRLTAALTFGIVAETETMPSALRARLEQQGASQLAEAAATAVRRPTSTGRRGSGGWLAAAACLILAVIGWMRPETRTPVTPPSARVQVKIPPAIVKEPEVRAKPRTAEEARNAMLTRSGTVKVVLAATKDPAGRGVTADVVWDPVTQTGFLHMMGLQPNDPKLLQYQAWIFDGVRDQRYPIDCAIFDVPQGKSEIVIPIQAAIPVSLAKAFAVTVEKPGGVVVPDKAHVVVLGTAG